MQLQMEVAVSKWVQGWIVVIHLIAMLVCFLLPINLLMQFGLAVVVCIFAYQDWKKYVIKQANLAIKFTNDSGWQLGNRDNYCPIQLLSSSVVTTMLIILHYKSRSRKKKTMLIVKDALSDENFRALTVALKLYGSK